MTEPRAKGWDSRSDSVLVKERVMMSEPKLDVFKVEYNWYKDVSAIAVGILLADVVRLVFQFGLYFFFLRH